MKVNQSDWLLAREHKIATVLGQVILHQNDPISLVQEAQTLWHFNAMRDVYYIKEFLRLKHLLLSHGLKIYPLKHILLTQSVYPKPGLRAFRDMDVLVSPNELEKVVDVLIQDGYEQQRPHGYFKNAQPQGQNIKAAKMGFDAVNLIKNEIFLELHTHFLPFQHYSIDVNDGQVSNEDVFVHLLVHPTRHYFNYGFRQLLDLKLWHDKKKPDLKKVKNKLDQYELWPMAYSAWQLAHVYFDLPKPPHQANRRLLAFTNAICENFMDMPKLSMQLKGTPIAFELMKRHPIIALFKKMFFPNKVYRKYQAPKDHKMVWLMKRPFKLFKHIKVLYVLIKLFLKPSVWHRVH